MTKVSDDKENKPSFEEMLLHEVRQNGRKLEKLDDRVDNIYAKTSTLGALFGAIAAYLTKFFH